MDSKQKFTEVLKPAYETDDWFLDSFSEFNINEKTQILYEIEVVSEFLPKNGSWTQFLYGVVKGKHPLFYVIDYLNEEGYKPLMIDIQEIDSDTYLDAMLDNNTIQYYYERYNRHNNSA